MHCVVLTSMTKTEVSRIIGDEKRLTKEVVNRRQASKLGEVFDYELEAMSEALIERLDGIVAFRAKRISRQWNKNDRALASGVDFRKGPSTFFTGPDGEFHNYRYEIPITDGGEFEMDLNYD